MIKNFIFLKHISSPEVVRGTVYPTLLAARLQVQHPQVLVCLAVVSSRRARFENGPYVGSMCHDYKFYIFKAFLGGEGYYGTPPCYCRCSGGQGQVQHP